MNKYTQRRLARIEDNICTQCGVREPIEGKRMCDPCLEVCLERIKLRNDTRSMHGNCRMHNLPVIPGKKSCYKCNILWKSRYDKKLLMRQYV